MSDIETELPQSEDIIVRVFRYSMIGRPDFTTADSRTENTWAPEDLMVRFARHTSYRGGLVVERSDWRLTNVRLHAWLRLKSGKTSGKVDREFEFEQLPREFVDGMKLSWYIRLDLDAHPSVAQIVDACRPLDGELC